MEEYVSDAVNALTYNRNLRMSVVQYSILFAVLIGSIIAAGRAAVMVACIGLILQAIVWMRLGAVGVSLIYCILLGYMTITRHWISKQNRIPEWIAWLVVFIIANLLYLDDMNRTTLLAHTVAYGLGALIALIPPRR